MNLIILKKIHFKIKNKIITFIKISLMLIIIINKRINMIKMMMIIINPNKSPTIKISRSNFKNSTIKQPRLTSEVKITLTQKILFLYTTNQIDKKRNYYVN